MGLPRVSAALRCLVRPRQRRFASSSPAADGTIGQGSQGGAEALEDGPGKRRRLRGPVRLPELAFSGDPGLSFVRSATEDELAAAVPGERLPSEYEPWNEEAQQWVFRYHVRDQLLPTLKSAAVEPLLWDDATLQWLTDKVEQPIPAWRQRLLLWLYRRRSVYFYDAQALLDAPDMWMLSTQQWRTLLGPQPEATCLDIGAGAGHCTRQYAPLFRDLIATEVSRLLVWRLRRKGLTAVRSTTADPSDGDLYYEGTTYDSAFCLNTLDRCQDPARLLADIRKVMRVGSTVVLSCPLPFLHLDFVTRMFLRKLSLEGDGSFESSAEAVAQHLLRPNGYFPRALLRTPYLSAGPRGQPVAQALDTAVFICEVGF